MSTSTAPLLPEKSVVSTNIGPGGHALLHPNSRHLEEYVVVSSQVAAQITQCAARVESSALPRRHRYAVLEKLTRGTL
jgi:hypothetical protein